MSSSCGKSSRRRSRRSVTDSSTRTLSKRSLSTPVVRKWKGAYFCGGLLCDAYKYRTVQSLDERIASLKDEIKSYDDMSADTRTALNGFGEQLRGTHTKIAGALGLQSAEAPSMAREPSDAAPSGSAPEHDTPSEAAPEHTTLNPRASVFEPSKGTRKRDTKRTLEKDTEETPREPQEPEPKRSKADGEDTG